MPATRVVVGVARRFVELGLALGVDGTADITLAMSELECRSISTFHFWESQYAREP